MHGAGCDPPLRSTSRLPESCNSKLVEGMVDCDQGQTLDLRLRGEETIERILVDTGHLARQESVGMGDVQSGEAALDDDIIERVDDFARGFQLPDPHLVCKLECSHRADMAFGCDVLDGRSGRVAKLWIGGEPPKKRVGIEKDAHSPLSPGNEYFPSHAASSSSDIGCRNRSDGILSRRWASLP